MKKKLFISLLLCIGLLCSIALGASAISLRYVTDEAGLLAEEQIQELSGMAEAIEENYGCAPYILIVQDYRQWAPEAADAQVAAEDIYIQYGLGSGEEHNGVLLMLSMAERDYAFVSYGERTHRAFTDYGQLYVEENILQYLRENEWYDACWSYLYDLNWLWEQAANGQPYDVNSAESEGMGLFIVGVPLIISLVVCLIMAAGMKNAKRKTEANDYMDQNGVNMRVVQDTFTHRSVSRRIIQDPPKSSGGGGTTVNSRGFSGRSGKF